MDYTLRVKQQFWVLVIISVFFLLGAPSVWYYTPDGGIYIGTAESMVETGQYRFNGYPNLLYYPGFSALLSLPIALFGINFHILHLFCAGIVVALLWIARAYFTPDRYGLVGILVPILIACTGMLQQQVFRILSDGTFLAVSLGALLLWRIYTEKPYVWAIVGCVALIAFAPMVRFQGLFVCFAFGVGLFLRSIRKGKRSPVGVVRAMAVGIAGCVVTLIPFAAWTWRNFQQYTPNTFNMANGTFFGQEGLALYGSGFGRVSWIDAEWKYPIYSIVESVQKLGYDFLGAPLYWVPVAIAAVFIVGLPLTGSLRWFKKATDMERAYVICCFLFVLLWLLRSHSLYSTVRQMYLPFLPFIVVCAGYSLGLFCSRLKVTRYAILYNVMVGFLVVLILSNGLFRFSRLVSQADYYRNANQAIGKVKDFLGEGTSPEVSVASTDWGVIPFYVKRKCYQLIDDESYVLTLERMNRYGTEYLAILDGMFFSRYARKMVEEFPQIFTLLMEAKPNGKGPTASVYKVDLKELYLILEDLRNDRK